LRKAILRDIHHSTTCGKLFYVVFTIPQLAESYFTWYSPFHNLRKAILRGIYHFTTCGKLFYVVFTIPQLVESYFTWYSSFHNLWKAILHGIHHSTTCGRLLFLITKIIYKLNASYSTALITSAKSDCTTKTSS
jgi:hypothetical protein